MSRKPLTSPFESFIEAQIRQAQDLNQRIARLNSRVADGPHSVILDQVTNGVAVRMAVLYLLAGGRAELADAAKRGAE